MRTSLSQGSARGGHRVRLSCTSRRASRCRWTSCGRPTQATLPRHFGDPRERGRHERLWREWACWDEPPACPAPGPDSHAAAGAATVHAGTSWRPSRQGTDAHFARVFPPLRTRTGADALAAGEHFTESRRAQRAVERSSAGRRCGGVRRSRHGPRARGRGARWRRSCGARGSRPRRCALLEEAFEDPDARAVQASVPTASTRTTSSRGAGFQPAPSDGSEDRPPAAPQPLPEPRNTLQPAARGTLPVDPAGPRGAGPAAQRSWLGLPPPAPPPVRGAPRLAAGHLPAPYAGSCCSWRRLRPPAAQAHGAAGSDEPRDPGEHSPWGWPWTPRAGALPPVGAHSRRELNQNLGALPMVGRQPLRHLRQPREHGADGRGRGRRHGRRGLRVLHRGRGPGLPRPAQRPDPGPHERGVRVRILIHHVVSWATRATCCAELVRCPPLRCARRRTPPIRPWRGSGSARTCATTARSWWTGGWPHGLTEHDPPLVQQAEDIRRAASGVTS
ncbi:hypothetical protein QJS66_16940 [Kocuria rhizophila]|nr:hypothetical protein QJS66_16940 [Kocuria rhizophila]